mgnify:CR=1 FL=1
MENWESRMKWRGNKGLARDTGGIRKRQRNFLKKFVIEGLAPPDGLPTFTRDQFPDPIRDMQKQMKSKPGFLEALLTDRIKKIKLGALAGPIPGGLRAKIDGKPVLVMPSFGVEQPGKTRLCYDFSRNPLDNEIPKRIIDSAWRKDFNSFYSKDEKTCSFDLYPDKAAFCVAFDAAGKYDLTGYYSQCRAHKDLRRFQAELLPMGGGRFALYINMNIMFGNAKAVSWCGTGNSVIHKALDSIKPEVLTTKHFRLPSSIDLKSSPQNEVLRKEKYGNPTPLLPSSFRDGKWYADWKRKTGCPEDIAATIETFLIHVDDTVVGAVNRGAVPATVVADERIRTAVGYLRARGIEVSDAKIEPAAEIMIVTGTELNFRDKTLSFPAEKWETFDERVRAVTEAEGEVSIETILKATGVAAHVSGLFRQIKVYLAPICRWTALYYSVREGEAIEWLRVKETRLEVPKVLSKLLAKGWRRAKARKVAHCRHLLASRIDATCIISADAAGKKIGDTWETGSREPILHAGMGAINHTTHQAYREMIPHNHPLSDWRIDCQESLCALGALEELARSGDVVAFHEDNKTTYNDMLSLKADAMQAAFVIRLAQICDEKNLIVLPQDTRSGVILADPLSRWELLSEHRIFDKKCRDWGVDSERIKVTTWNWRRTYETWMRIQTNYSFCQVATIPAI